MMTSFSQIYHPSASFTLTTQTYNKHTYVKTHQTGETNKQTNKQTRGWTAAESQASVHRPEWQPRWLADQVGHLLTEQPDLTFKMVNIDFSLSVCAFLFPSMSQSAMTNPAHLVNVAVDCAAFKCGGINPSHDLTAPSREEGWRWWWI